MNRSQLGRFLIPAAAAVCLAPFISSALALVLGIALALAIGNPYFELTRKYTHRLLALSVVGLGAGMDLGVVGRVGARGIGYTVVGISSTLLFGILLGKFLKTGRDTSVLITAGTAICGGSAIAAVAPAIGAKHHEVSVALGTVFLLNAIALLIFPFIGHELHLSQAQFGLWSALAIHDTSSVVGATLQYGKEALQIGTTVKLARALWIVPVTIGIGFFIKPEMTSAPGAVATKPKRPWFILGFIAAAALVTWVPALRDAGHVVDWVARRMLVLTLFLIGVNLTPATLKSVGLRPLVQGVILWICVASATLGAISANWIH